MTRTPRARLWRSALAASAAITVTAGVVAAAPEAEKVQPAPKLSLIAASTSVTLDSWKEDPGVYLDLGTYVTAENGPLELKVTRKSYKDPVIATQIIREGRKTRTRTLPRNLVKDFSGLPGFAQVTLTNAAGKAVLTKTEAFCPNNASGRIRPDAPATSKYPQSCPVNPFTLGSVWGVENGWASNTYAGYYSAPVVLPAGTMPAGSRSATPRPAPWSGTPGPVTSTGISPTSPATGCSRPTRRSRCAAARRPSAWPTPTRSTTR